MTSSTNKDYPKRRNLYVKVAISFLIGLGIFCAIFAIRSCRWFVFLQDETSVNNRVFENWEFLPEMDMNSTISIGLFRYQTTTISEDGTDTDDDYDDALNVTTTTISATTTTTTTNEDYFSTSNDQCISYPEFWVGIDHQWKFTAQLCVVLGPIIAFVSWCVIIVGATRLWICSFLLLATGLQTATVVSSLSWCDQYWNCPWLLGALVNVIAACLFLLGWFFAMWGLVEIEIENSSSSSGSSKEQGQKGEQQQQQQRRDSQNTNSESTEPGNSYPSSVIMTNISADDKNEEFSSTAGETNSQQVVADLEDGSNTILYHNYNPSVRDDNELYYDASFDEESKSTMKRISQSNQMFLDLDAKLKERRDKVKLTSAPSEEEGRKYDHDVSSTDNTVVA